MGGGGNGINLITSINQYSYIDSVYLRLLIIFGIVPTVIFLCFTTLAMKYERDIVLLLILTLIFITGIIEQHFIDIAYNPFFMLMITDYFRERGKLN